MSTTETATAAMMRESARAAAMNRLLDALRDHLRAYPREEQDLPELDIVWTVDPTGDGPQREILEAIASQPSLWAHAIPPTCAIVPVSDIKRLLGDHVVDFLRIAGATLVENYALSLRVAP